MCSHVCRNDIITSLRRLGIGAGTKLMVHSSMKSFGVHVDGGATAVIEALMAVLTDQGTLMMPSFNHYTPFGGGGPGHYDPLSTPTTDGLIPQTFWQMRRVCRSLNPTHAIAVWGRHAERYVRHHHRTLTFGSGSPLSKLYRDGGLCLFIGVLRGANSFQHVVETMSNAPCLGRRTEQYPVRLPDGRIVPGRTWSWRSDACPCQGAWADELARHEIRTTVGASVFRLYSLQHGFGVIAGHLRCDGCPVRPRRNEYTVASDWDDGRGELRPSSAALAY